jgi:hypothetical protein
MATSVFKKIYAVGLRFVLIALLKLDSECDFLSMMPSVLAVKDSMCGQRIVLHVVMNRTQNSYLRLDFLLLAGKNFSHHCGGLHG